MATDVLLIYPPFSPSRGPYASVPVLAAHLRSRNMRVAAVDANAELFLRFLTPERIDEGMRFAESRFIQLNGKRRLDLAEMTEYDSLANALHRSESLRNGEGRLFSPGREAGPGNVGENLGNLHSLLSLASSPYFPETLSVTPRIKNIRYQSRFSAYSTADILRSVRSNGLLSGFFEDLLYPVLTREAPRLVGISVPFPSQVFAAFRCARAIKKRLPKVHVVMGGAFISCCMRNLAEPRLFDLVDSIVLDDGEAPLEWLAGELSSTKPNLTRVPGLMYRAAGKIARNEPAPLADIGSSPPPDYLALNLDRYLVPRKTIWLPFRLSRGCPWARCAFCRTRLSIVCHHQQPPVDRLYEQLRKAMKRTGTTHVSFTDETSPPEILEALSRRIIKDKFKIVWAVNARFDPGLTLERCLLYRQAGCVRINFGLETYNDRLLRLIRKGTNAKLIQRVLANIAWAGLSTCVYMIVGLPTETQDEALESFAAVEKLKEGGLISEFSYNPFSLLLYSAIANDPKQYGITRISVPKAQDLDGPILDFECAGMSRKTAALLCHRFNRERREPLREVGIGPKKVRLNHDLDKMKLALIARFYTEPAFGRYVTFRQTPHFHAVV